MRTTKAISTISFNTKAFLAQKLEELTKAGRISFWAFIPHKPEDDEAGKKHHHHVFVEPSKMLQTDDLKAELKEFDPTHPDKPLGCLTWRSSKFDEWYLYGLHDRAYLASKGQSRAYHYTHEEMVTSDDDDLLCRSRSIDRLSISPYADMEEAQKLGLTFAEYFARGTVPLPQVKLFETAWHLLIANRTDRNRRPNHPDHLPEGVKETGEVVEGSDLANTIEEAKELHRKATDRRTKWDEWGDSDDDLPFDTDGFGK